MKKLVGCSSSLALMSFHAFGQPYPAKPVRMIVPYPPGGGNDTLGRLFAAKLGDRIGQPFIVENRPGAGTMIGTEAAAKSPPDGYTLLLSSIATHALSPNLYSRVPYDPIKDFAPITLLGIAPTVLVVNQDLPAQVLAELVSLAKSKPGRACLRLGRQRHAAAHQCRSVQVGRRRRPSARRLQRRRTGADRPHRRPRARDARHRGVGDAACARREAACARALRAEALGRIPRAAHLRRGGASGLRHQRLVFDARARRHAARDRAAA